jgi:type I restriction enzyme S subunit
MSDFNAEAQRRRGWEVRRLKTLASCNDEVLPESTSDFARIEYIEISDVDESRGIFNSTFHVFKDAPSRARRIARKGDVIISTVRTYLKAIATIEREGLVVSTGFAVLRARTSVLPRFLAYAVKSAVFKDNVVRYSTGTSYPAINASDLMCLSIPLPPISEQKAIVAYLDAETGKIDRAIEVKRRQIELLRERRQIVIDEAVRGEPRRREPLQKLTRATAKPGAADAAPYKTKGGA